MTSKGMEDRVLRLDDVPGQPSFVRVVFEQHEPVEISIKIWTDYGLRTGSTVTPEQLERLEVDGQRALFYHKAVNYLRYRARTKYEMTQYLKRKECPGEIVADVVIALENAGYLNDELYARQFVATKGSAYSRQELRWKLKQRGVATRICEQVIGQEAAYDECSTAKSMAEKQWLRRQDQPLAARRARVGAFLQRKGFPSSVIYKVLNELGAGNDDTFDVP